MEPKQEHKVLREGLKVNDLTLDEGHFTRFYYCPSMPSDLPFKSWSDPRVWRNAAKKLLMWSRVVVIDEKMTKYAEFVVTDLDYRENYVRLQLLQAMDLQPRKQTPLSASLARNYSVDQGVTGFRGRRHDGGWRGEWRKEEADAIKDCIDHDKRPGRLAA